MPRNHRILSLALAAGFIATASGAAFANESVNKAISEPGNWAVYGRDQANTHYSPLKEINSENVKGLKVAYSLQLGSLRSNESTPIVVGDTLYVSSSWGPKTVFAIDPATGVQKWKYEPDLPSDLLQYGCCDVVNRGVSYGDGKIYVGRLDGNVTALDAKTGKEVWDVTVVDYKQGSVITSPPLVVKNLVVTGYGGGEYGARGSIVALDSKTGKQVWQTWTVPGPGEPGNDTWKGDSWKQGGGAAWLVASYDAKTDTIIMGTSNPSPWNASVRSTGTSDLGKLINLYTASTLGLDTKTGKIKWHQQATPADAWDYDGVNEAILVDLDIGGAKTPVFLKADRNGFFYVANREDGKVISAKTYVPTNWAKSFDLKTGRPVEDPAKRPRMGFKAENICPNLLGGKNWQPMAYSADTGLVYIPSNNVCMDMIDTEVEYKRGSFYLGKEFPAKAGPGGYLGELIAWDPVKQEKRWGVKETAPFNGGVLATGGNLVFSGDLDGWFRAIDAKSGEVLWKFNTGSGIGAAPSTFTAGGKQYVAVVTGRSVSIPPFLGDIGKTMTRTPEGGALFVFSN